MSFDALKVSFEFFPGKTPEAAKLLHESTLALAASCDPAFMTVTYGAGGQAQGQGAENPTLAALWQIKHATTAKLGAHMTCITTPREKLMAMAEELWRGGIRHIVALRGDKPKDPALRNLPDSSYYAYAADLVTALRARHGFEITVGAYPEKHPEAPDLDTDIRRLQVKCEAGATRAITQFFFDNDVFFRFRDRAHTMGVRVPVLPGVLPVLNYERMLRFAASCQASVPAWLRARFESSNDHAVVAEEILIRQCEGLRAGGVGHIHFYTLNNATLPRKACQALGLAIK